MTLGRLGEKSVKSSVLEVTVQVGGKEGDPGKAEGEHDPGETWGEGHEVLGIIGDGRAVQLVGEDDPWETRGEDREAISVGGDGRAVHRVGGDDDPGKNGGEYDPGRVGQVDNHMNLDNGPEQFQYGAVGQDFLLVENDPGGGGGSGCTSHDGQRGLGTLGILHAGNFTEYGEIADSSAPVRDHSMP